MNNKYQQGMVSALDLTTSHNAYLQAESNYFTAMLQLLQAQAALEKLLNTM